MRPQHQTKFGGDRAPLDERGNCFAACVATLLELDLATLPNFCAEPDDEWWAKFNAWLGQRGWFAIMLKGPDREWAPVEALCIAGGPAARGHLHCCVYDGRGLVHDPHPDGTGLIEVQDLTFLLPIDPSAASVRA